MSEIEDPTPVSDDFDRRAEVERLLAEDDTVIGSIWRYEQEGLSLHEMAEREGVTTGPVYAARSLIRVLRDGYLPAGPTVAAQSAARVRAWLKGKELSSELRAALTEQESLLVSRAEDQEAQTEEIAGAVKATMAAEATGVTGIYVYTLPHYLRHPYDPDTGRTLLKVGHSSVDAFYRAGSQGRLTALPETRSCCASTRQRIRRTSSGNSTLGCGTPITQAAMRGAAGRSGS